MKMLHATVSHDMMNPLGAVKQFADEMMAASANQDAEQMRKCHTLVTDSTKLVICRMRDLLD